MSAYREFKSPIYNFKQVLHTMQYTISDNVHESLLRTENFELLLGDLTLTVLETTE